MFRLIVLLSCVTFVWCNTKHEYTSPNYSPYSTYTPDNKYTPYGRHKDECGCFCRCAGGIHMRQYGDEVVDIFIDEFIEGPPRTTVVPPLGFGQRCTPCPPGYYQVADYGCYYHMVSNETHGWTYDIAATVCFIEKNQGRLAIFDDNNHYRDVVDYVIPEKDLPFELLWIGASYLENGDLFATENGFWWRDGRRVQDDTYEWWPGNEPGKAIKGLCLNALASRDHNHCLGYTYCDVRIGFICHKPITICPDE